MIVVEVHPFAVDATRKQVSASLSNLQPTAQVRDVGPDVVDVTWSDSVASPYHSVDLSMRGPSWIRPVNIGDHLVVRLGPNLPAVAWAIVIDVKTSVRIQSDGSLSKNTWDVTAVGWFDYIGRVDMLVVNSLREQDVDGTVFGASDNPYSQIKSQLYDPAVDTLINNPALAGLVAPTTERPLPNDGVAGVFEAINNVATLNNVGKALDIFLRTALRIYLPPTLNGASFVGPATDSASIQRTAPAPATTTSLGLLRESVRAVYDSETATAFCGAGTVERAGQPPRAAEPVVGTRPTFQNIANGSSKIGGVIQGTWAADQLIVEMFPSLEDPGSGLDPNATAKRFVNRVVGEAAARAGIAESFIPQPIGAAGAPVGAGILPGVGQALGRNPVLIYRVRPWRTQPLLDWVNSLVAYDPQFRPLAVSIAQAIGEVPTVQQITWDVSRAVRVEMSDVFGLDIEANDDDVATLFTAQWAGGDTPELFNASAGLPIFDTATLTFGGRLYTVSWPFCYGNDGLSAPTKSSIQQQVQIIAAMAAQFGLQNQRFYSGTVSCRFRPDVRHGEPVSFAFPGQTLIGYCERVQHSISISESGVATKRTSVTFSRGCWSEINRTYPPPVDIPLTDITSLERTA